jgi:hypothetical protein
MKYCEAINTTVQIYQQCLLTIHEVKTTCNYPFNGLVVFGIGS